MVHRRWSTEDKMRIVMEAMNTNISIAELCRKYNLNPNLFYQWKNKFIEGGKIALSGSINANKHEAEIERLKKIIEANSKRC